MFYDVFNKEKWFSFYFGTMRGKLKCLFNVFSNERTWKLIKGLLHSVSKEISHANITKNARIFSNFILRNNIIQFFQWVTIHEKGYHKYDQQLPCYLRYVDRNTIFSTYISIYLEFPRKWRNGSRSCIYKFNCEAWSV